MTKDDLINRLKESLNSDADAIKIDMEYVPTLIEALDRQTAKKPIVKDYGIWAMHEEGIESHIYRYFCPSCKDLLTKYQGCDNNKCNQKIDWSDQK